MSCCGLWDWCVWFALCGWWVDGCYLGFLGSRWGWCNIVAGWVGVVFGGWFWGGILGCVWMFFAGGLVWVFAIWVLVWVLAVWGFGLVCGFDGLCCLRWFRFDLGVGVGWVGWVGFVLVFLVGVGWFGWFGCFRSWVGWFGLWVDD